MEIKIHKNYKLKLLDLMTFKEIDLSELFPFKYLFLVFKFLQK